MTNGLKDTDIEIGTNPLPHDAQTKLAEFLDWIDAHYEVKNGVTNLFWKLSYDLGREIIKK